MQIECYPFHQSSKTRIFLRRVWGVSIVTLKGFVWSERNCLDLWFASLLCDDLPQILTASDDVATGEAGGGSLGSAHSLQSASSLACQPRCPGPGSDTRLPNLCLFLSSWMLKILLSLTANTIFWKFCNFHFEQLLVQYANNAIEVEVFNRSDKGGNRVL